MTTSTIVLIVAVAIAAILAHRRNRVGGAQQTHPTPPRRGRGHPRQSRRSVPQGGATRSARRRDRRQGPRRPSRSRRQGSARDRPATPGAVRRTDAATARDEVNQEFERADKIDPDTQTPDDTATRLRNPRDTARTSRGKQDPPSMPRSGYAANPRRPNWVGSSPIDHAAATTNELVPAVRRPRPTKDARAGHMRHRDSSSTSGTI